MLAMAKFNKLEEIWNTISNDQAYKGRLGWSAIIKILFGSKSVLDNKPLWNMLQQHVFLKDVKSDKYDLKIGAVSLVSGEYRAFKPSDFDNDDDFRKAVLASTAIPVIWEPVKEIKLKNKLHFVQAVDGGIRNISPLGDILDDNPSEVIIINCSSLGLRLNPDTNASKNIFRIAKRSLTEITIDEIFNSDLREFLRINDLMKQAEAQGCILKKQDGRPYKAFKTVLIEPDRDLGDTLDFSQNAIKFRIAEGYKAAEQAFRGYFW
jgi:NTE family protein